MDDFFVYCINLPPGIHEAVTPCADGYTIYLNIADSRDVQKKALRHALMHIKENDFARQDVQKIEKERHGGD